jgi:hypothetical protein
VTFLNSLRIKTLRPSGPQGQSMCPNNNNNNNRNSNNNNEVHRRLVSGKLKATPRGTATDSPHIRDKMKILSTS